MLHEFQIDFSSELEKFNNWKSHTKKCNYCLRELPRNTYFFRGHPQHKYGLYNKCKECEGKKFSWGSKQKERFKKDKKWYCVKCDTVYPLNDIYFVKNKNTATGYSVRCKRCSPYGGSEFGISRFLNKIIEHKEAFQICLKCFVEFPRTQEYFYKQEKNGDKYETTCKKCQGGEYGITCWNTILDLSDGERYCVDCKQIKDIDDFYYKDRKSDIRYSRCKDCHYISSQNRREEANNSNYTLEDWEFALNFFKSDRNQYACAYCGIEHSVLEKDHVFPFSKGGKLIKSNIIPACVTCNRSKWNLELIDFYNNRDYFSEERLTKIVDYLKVTNNPYIHNLIPKEVLDKII